MMEGGGAYDVIVMDENMPDGGFEGDGRDQVDQGAGGGREGDYCGT